MVDIRQDGPVRPGFAARLNRLVASRGFQSWAARFPLTRRIARAEGEALFDLVAGFVHSQTLMALVELRILHRLMDGPARPAQLAAAAGVSPDRLEVLMQAGAALGLMKRRRDGRFQIARKGAALLGVPGLESMILHHTVLYRDLADPVAFLRGETEPELAGFWPYVFGAAAAGDADTAARYSDLMADSQKIVAEDTLDAVSLKGVSDLLDIGGGTGAFLAEAGARWPKLRLALFDLPAVVPGARARFERAGLKGRARIIPGSFRDDPLPMGADAVSLIRVLYDHRDETVAALLSSVRDAMQPGGLLIVSEPMSGGATPERAGDVYFALYCMAMGTGTVRSAARISALLAQAGFEGIEERTARRPFVTRTVVARAPVRMS